MKYLLTILLMAIPMLASAHPSAPTTEPPILVGDINWDSTNEDTDISIPEFEEKTIQVKVKKPSFFDRLRQKRRAKSMNWTLVDARLQEKLVDIYMTMQLEGYDMRMVEGYRTPERQAELQQNGGGVTQVGPGRSCHQYGLAVDSAVFVKGKATWNMKDPKVRSGYMRFGELATMAGLQWGGHWTSLKDYPHVEMRSACQLAIRNNKAIDPQRSYANQSKGMMGGLVVDGSGLCTVEAIEDPFLVDIDMKVSIVPDPFEDLDFAFNAVFQTTDICLGYDSFGLTESSATDVWMNLQELSHIATNVCPAWSTSMDITMS